MAGGETRVPEVRLCELLIARGLTLATAESCTAGGLAHRITRVAGASEYFLGGVVAYSNRAKTRFLAVCEDALERYGAVSRETAEAMAVGAARGFDADLGVGITEIAGPGGGSEDKPVGLVFVAVGSPGNLLCRRFEFSGDRHAVRDSSVAEALRMLLCWLDTNESGPIP